MSLKRDQRRLKDATNAGSDNEQRNHDDPWASVTIQDESKTSSPVLALDRCNENESGIAYSVHTPNPNTINSPYLLRRDMY